MKKLIGLLAAVLASVLSFGVYTGTAQAKSVTCNEAGVCIVRCSQTLSNGTFIEYDEGTQITATGTDGKTYTFKCVNGQWVQQAALVVIYPGYFGTITPVGIGPLKVAEADTPTGLAITADKAGTIRLRRPDFGGGCDPNTVGCPG